VLLRPQSGGLLDRPRTDTWAMVVDELDGRPEWRGVVRRLAPASGLVTLPDLRAFQQWGPHVARFSFLLSGVGPRI
jgi:hypothetical protein